MTPDWFVQNNGRQEGPHSARELRKLVEAGRITAASLVRRGPEGEWVAATKVQGLLVRMPPSASANGKGVADRQESHAADEDILSWLGPADVPAPTAAVPGLSDENATDRSPTTPAEVAAGVLASNSPAPAVKADDVPNDWAPKLAPKRRRREQQQIQTPGGWRARLFSRTGAIVLGAIALFGTAIAIILALSVHNPAPIWPKVPDDLTGEERQSYGIDRFVESKRPELTREGVDPEQLKASLKERYKKQNEWRETNHQ